MKKEFFQLNHKTMQIEKSHLPPPVVTYITSEKMWRLEDEYECHFGGHKFVIQQGFLFDLASIPRLFWRLIAPYELSISAPLLHDYLYRYRGDPPAGTIEPVKVFTRRESDELFRDLMVEEGVSTWRRKVAYWAVRWFGKWAWGH